MHTFTPNTAYVIGIAIGDGNLSNLNGRATRLRITCDNKYPKLMERMVSSVKKSFPRNKVSLYRRVQNCTDISCYSNSLESILGWKALGGPKHVQNVRVPKWIFLNEEYMKKCLQGLFETDGCIYKDRKYTYVNFTTIIPELANDVIKMIKILDYSPTIQSTIQKSGKRKFVVRICKNSVDFIKEIGMNKS